MATVFEGLNPVTVTLLKTGVLTTGDGKDYAYVPYDFLIDEIVMRVGTRGDANATNINTEVMLGASGTGIAGYANLFAANSLQISGNATANTWAVLSRTSFNSTGKKVMKAGTIFRLDLDEVPNTGSNLVRVDVYGVAVV